MYQLKGIAGQNYNQLSEAEKAQVQAAGDSFKQKNLSTIQSTWNPEYVAEFTRGTEESALEAAQRAAESIFTQRSNAMMQKQVADAMASGGYGSVTRGDANTIPNIQAQGQALLQGAAPAGSAADVLQKGIASGTVSATDPTAQFNASMKGNNVNAPGINPVAPIQAQMNAIPSVAKAPDDPSYQYNTQTGQPNPNFKGQVGAIPPASTTSPTTGTSTTGASASDLAGQYSALQGLSAEEQKLKDEQTRLDDAFRGGKSDVGDQAINMSFISGQQKSLEDRYNNSAQTLQEKLANAQQKRQASLDAVKFQLERSDKETERQDKLAKEAKDEAYRRDVLLETKRNNTLDSQKTTGTGTGTSSTSGDFAATIDSVANLEGTVAGKNAVRSQLKSHIANKDYVSAYTQIANTVENALVGEAKQRYANARTDYQVMGGLTKAVQDFTQAGGNTGLLKGSAEEIARKLGQVTDPKLSALAVQLQREFQTYRNTMTGAAFSPEESREYASVNPTANKNLDLNIAVLQGAQAQLKNRVESTINSRVPSAKYILDYANGATTGNASNNSLLSQYGL